MKREHFKKVVRERTVHTGSDLSSRRGTITLVNHYKRKLSLECGHSQMRSHSAPVPATAYCKECALGRAADTCLWGTGRADTRCERPAIDGGRYCAAHQAIGAFVEGK